jgi:dihydrofolate synthase/folylpolyglutamate synthase
MTSSRTHIIMPHWPISPWKPPVGEPLERMARLLEALGNPQEKLPPVVHVAGTNGKGSTIATMRAILEAAGYKVHTYTSPHIKKFNERITLAGETIADDVLFELLERCRMANEEQEITFFEGTTAAALLAFSEHPADVLLMETGMGGLLDPTNVVEKPRLCVITSISPDHMEYLGETLAEIAVHKAGIIKAEVPVICSFQPPEVLAVIEKRAEKSEAPLMIYGKHWAVQKSTHGFIYADAYGQAEFPMPALKGPHQLVNVGNAIAALSLLEEFDVTADAIAAGLRWVQWPGRLEEVTDEILSEYLPVNFSDNLQTEQVRGAKRGGMGEDSPTAWNIWFDGGHNMAAGHVLSVVAEQEWADRPLYVICGTTRGKAVAPMLLPLKDLAQEIYAVPVAAEPKCYTPQEIADQCDDAGIRVRVADSVAEAVEDIIASAETAGRILIFGSLYLRLEVVEYSV